jgi:ClpP class serine protease
MASRRERFVREGILALEHKAFGGSFEIVADLPPEAPPYVLERGMAVVSVPIVGDGPLVQHADPFWDSYDAIVERARAAFAEPEASVVVLKVNSPGGDAPGCIETSRALRAMADESGKKLVTYVDGVMASAAYAIGCAAHLIFASQTAKVGSIGVFDALLDVTAQDRAMGVKYTFVASGSRKLVGNPHVPTTDESIAVIGKQVNAIASMFFDLVAEMRGRSAKDIAALEGESFLAASAKAMGLIDSVRTWAEVTPELQEESAMTVQAASQARSADQAKSVAWEEAVRCLLEHSDGDDEEKKAKAKRMLAAMLEDDEKPEPKEEELKEEPKPEGSAASSPEQECEQSKALLALAQKVQALHAERQAEKEQSARAQLLSMRPDFSPEVRKTLEAMPLTAVEEAVKTWPRTATPGGVRAAAVAAAGLAMPTVFGEHQGEYSPALSEEEARLLDKAFGKRAAPPRAFAQRSIVGSADRNAAAEFLRSLEPAVK